jgi:hypothetical protein
MMSINSIDNVDIIKLNILKFESIDRWVDETPLKTLFSRLFDLCFDNDKLVADTYTFGWGFHGNGWRRRLFAWDEELWGECCGV